MKKALRIAAKTFLFFALSMLFAWIVPYYELVGSWLSAKVSLEFAISVSKIVLGEVYPEPLDVVYGLVCLVINTIITVMVYKLVMLVIRVIKQKIRE
ncbi:hypothetical protein [Pseudomonas akapageensis]|uniref:hypothetical protein n=1 Tax=Pseudomonas akapageensis TaxID=2609961 RepID=UPI0014099735|nr:hypothetical protein [Pseudomonas akapageensis]